MTVSDTQLSESDKPKLQHVGFLLIPEFAMLPYASVIEPLRAANRLSGQNLYRWSHISIDGAAVAASNGVKFAAEHAVGTGAEFDYVFACAGGNPSKFLHRPTFAWLRRLARRRVKLGGISGGPYLLARAGVLAGYRFTIHWEHAPAFAEEYPDLDLRRSLFEIDRDRLTSSGGTAPLDMMHHLIAQEHGSSLAVAVSEWFLQTHVREGAGSQRMPLRERLGIAHLPLLRVIGRMEQTVENPLPRAELAALAGLSIRQLERLFRKHLDRSIDQHYLGLRLEHARALLRQTSLSVLETAMACGFTSASHFSRCYRDRYGTSPQAERLHKPTEGRDVPSQRRSLRS